MENNKRVNGWTSYETWIVWIGIESDVKKSTFWRTKAKEINQLNTFKHLIYDTHRENAELELSEILKKHHENIIENSIIKDWRYDLIYSAFSKINWLEISKRLFEIILDEN